MTIILENPTGYVDEYLLTCLSGCLQSAMTLEPSPNEDLRAPFNNLTSFTEYMFEVKSKKYEKYSKKETIVCTTEEAGIAIFFGSL